MMGYTTEIPDRASVERIAEASVGDWVWEFRSEQARYDRKTKEYLGRGVFVLTQIAGSNRASFFLAKEAKQGYDRKTGAIRPRSGYTSGDFLAGQCEREAREYLAQHAYRLADAIRACKDVDVLREVAKLIGYDDQR